MPADYVASEFIPMPGTERLRRDLSPERSAVFEEILKHELYVSMSEPVHGFWDGGAKSEFTFTPSLRFYQVGEPNIKWGSWGANMWWTDDVEPGETAEAHMKRQRRKLMRGKPRRMVELRLR